MPKIARPDRLAALEAAEISAAGIRGLTAISPDGEEVGTVDDILMTDGNVDAVVIEIGGLMGLGSKRVGVKVRKLDVLADPYDKHYLRIPLTRDELDANVREAEAAAIP